MQATCRVAEVSCRGRRLEAVRQPQNSLRLPARVAGRAGRRQLKAQALLQEIDLGSAVASLQDVMHFHAATAAAAVPAVSIHLAGATASGSGSLAQGLLGSEQLQHLLTLADAAAQRIADLADAAVATAAAADAGGSAEVAGEAVKDNGWLQPLVGGLETVLQYIQDGLDQLKVPYSYGWSIVALTACVKLATYPLTKKQVESALNVQALKPKIDAIKAQYGEDKEAIQRETSALYEKAGIDPLAGCLPSIATIPIFIGLFRSLSDFASREEAGSAAFYWIPSLAGPTSVAAQKAGAGIAWLLPLVDGAPPIGWDLAARYLVLPIGLVAAQYVSQAIITPPQTDDTSDTAKFTKNIVKVLPLMIGWFSLNVPSGLSLYYFANTVLTTLQQIYLKKLGGANLLEYDLGPIELGKARRTGTIADSLASSDPEAAASSSIYSMDISAAKEASAAAEGGDAAQLALAASAAAPAAPKLNRRCKRRRRELLEAAA